MPGAHQVLKLGPATYEVSTSVTGGQLVEPDGAGRVRPAGDGSVTVLGVAMADAQPADSASTDPAGNLLIHKAQPHVAVGYIGEFKLTFTAATVPFGARVVAAADGAVRAYDPAAVTPDTPDQIVGRVTEPDGAPASGRARVRFTG